MNRTIKFQLSNVKTSILVAALITYGIMGLFLGIAFFVDQSVITNITNQPIWLNLLSIVAAPFALLAMMYALFDAMFFDTSIRFGISRTSYFITQLVIYLILSLLVSFATGVTETEWTGAASSYFSEISQNYLSIGYLIDEFIKNLAIATMMLAVYRFKAKAFIPVAVLFGLFIMVVSFSGATESPILFEMMIHTINFVMEYKEIFVGLLIAAMIGIYYLFITKSEVQD